MELTGWIMAAAAVTGTIFWVLVACGVFSWFRKDRRRRAAEARAGQRFALGEIDEAEFRRLWADLRARS